MARRRRGSKGRRVTPLSGVWLAIAAAFSCAAVMTESLLWVIAGVLALAAGVLACVNPEAGQIAARAAVPAQRAAAASGPKPGGSRRAKPSRAKAGTPRKASAAGTGRKPPCGARCRRSTKAKDTCDCICKGSAHGSEAGRTYAGSRAELKSTKLKAQEKRHVREVERT